MSYGKFKCTLNLCKANQEHFKNKPIKTLEQNIKQKNQLINYFDEWINKNEGEIINERCT